MLREIYMPQLGMVQTEGKILEWLKSEGDSVRKDEVVAIIETDKATCELQSPCDGVLTGISASSGTSVPVGKVMAWVRGADEPSLASYSTSLPEAGEPNSPGERKTVSELSALPSTKMSDSLSTPGARRLASASGISLDDVVPTGPAGRIIEADVRRSLEHRQEAQSEGAMPWTEIPATRIRLATALKLESSAKEIPHFYLQLTVGASCLLANPDVGATQLVRSVDDWVVKACARALKEHRALNASWHEGSIRQYRDINIGIAVNTGQGLIVPVIHHADRLSAAQVTSERQRLVEGAKKGSLDWRDLSDATFTLTNLGALGIDTGWPLINPPQAAILAIGRAQWRPDFDGKKVVPRFVLTFTLAADHRVVDGAKAAAFLQTVATALENTEGADESGSS